MTLNERIDLLVALGKHLLEFGDYLEAVIHRTEYNNPWFTRTNQRTAITAIAQQFLEKTTLQQWASAYALDDNITVKRIGLVLAGNIPLVGWHDIMTTFVAGHQSIIKLSDKDQYLLPYFFKWMSEQNPASQAYFQVVDKLRDFDAVIATGSNNSARYFESYFGKYPHIIRKNRNAIAVLSGRESSSELIALGQDIFQFYGLGCRNVSKLFVPTDYNFDTLLETLHEHYKSIILHSKYKNNFDYNYAMYMLNKVSFLSNGCLILVENSSNTSRIATLHYEYYDDIEAVKQQLQTQADTIQCVVSKLALQNLDVVPYGKAQTPTISDYADGVDTMQFMLSLN